MGICLSQADKEQPVFSQTPIGPEMRNLSGVDCSMFEKYIWVLKQYPLLPRVSMVVVAVTDFNVITFHISDYQDILDEPFLVLMRREIRRLTYREIIEQVNQKTPKC